MAKYHKNKEISEAIEYAISKGWRFVKNKRGYAFGRILCPSAQRGGCAKSVWSTPRVPEDHARQIVAYVDDCTHDNEEEAGQ